MFLPMLLSIKVDAIKKCAAEKIRNAGHEEAENQTAQNTSQG